MPAATLPTTAHPGMASPASALPEPAEAKPVAHETGASGSAEQRLPHRAPDLVHRSEALPAEPASEPTGSPLTPVGNEPIVLQPPLTIPLSVRRARKAQPAVTTPAPRRPADTETVATPEGPVRVDRSDAGARAAREMDADAFTVDDTVVIPPDHGPLDEGRGQQLLAHELVHIRQQRSLGPDLPSEESSAGQSLEREARSAESIAARPAAVPPELTLARRPGPRPTDAGTEARLPGTLRAVAAVAEREDRAPSEPPAAMVDPSMAPETAASLPTGGDVATQRSVASETGENATSPDEAGGDGDMDDMARQLYERIRYRLRRELLLDRERGGYLTDMR
jgi:hypothetical protein